MKNTPQSTIDKLLKQNEKSKEANELSKEEAATLKRCCINVFSTAEGKIVARHMMKMSGIYIFPDMVFDTAASAFKKGMTHMYLFFIKGQLKPKTLMEIETKEK